MSENRLLAHVTVAAIVEREGRFLFVEESSRGRQVVNQPAGHLEPDESMEEAVKREMLEETGWQFEPEYLVGIYHFKGKNGVTYVRFTYAGQLGEQAHDGPIDPKITRTHWLTVEELAGHALRSPIVQRSIQDYRQGQRFPDELIYGDGQYDQGI